MVYESIPTNNWLVFHPPRNTLNNQGPFCHCSSFYSWRSPLQPLISGHFFFVNITKRSPAELPGTSFLWMENILSKHVKTSFWIKDAPVFCWGFLLPPLPFHACFFNEKTRPKCHFRPLKFLGCDFCLDIQKPPDVFPDTIFWACFFL